MKRFFCLFLTAVLFISLTACTSNENLDKVEVPPEYMSTPCSKDFVDDFMSVIDEVELGGLYSGMKLDKEHCYNVTPICVAEQTDFKIFKFSDSCVSFVLIDGAAYLICESFGGYGFFNAMPWDYDGDSNLDLLVASSWGSGLHRSVISVFNTITKESVIIYDTSTTDDHSVDLFVAESTPSSSYSEDLPVSYQIYTAKIEVKNDNFSDLSYVATGVAGSVAVENGMPVFKPMGE